MTSHSTDNHPVEESPGKRVQLPRPDADNITVLTRELPNEPILPWHRFDSPWLRPDADTVAESLEELAADGSEMEIQAVDQKLLESATDISDKAARLDSLDPSQEQSSEDAKAQTSLPIDQASSAEVGSTETDLDKANASSDLGGEILTLDSEAALENLDMEDDVEDSEEASEDESDSFLDDALDETENAADEEASELAELDADRDEVTPVRSHHKRVEIRLPEPDLGDRPLASKSDSPHAKSDYHHVGRAVSISSDRPGLSDHVDNHDPADDPFELESELSNDANAEVD